MSKVKSININGLLIDGENTIHPVVLEYLKRKGVKLSKALGYLDIEIDKTKFPNTEEMINEIESLAMELYGKITFVYCINESKNDIEFCIEEMTSWHKLKLEFPDADDMVIWNAFIAYLENKGAKIIYTKDDKSEFYHEGGEFNTDESLADAELFNFVNTEIQRLESEKANQPGLFASYYNWIFGSESQSTKEKAAPDAPKPRI